MVMTIMLTNVNNFIDLGSNNIVHQFLPTQLKISSREEVAKWSNVLKLIEKITKTQMIPGSPPRPGQPLKNLFQEQKI